MQGSVVLLIYSFFKPSGFSVPVGMNLPFFNSQMANYRYNARERQKS
jgi:hypothetical protein